MKILKKMKKLLSLIALGITLSLTAQTERQKSEINPRMTQEQYLQKFEGLNITADQREKLIAVYVNKQLKKQSIRKEKGEFKRVEAETLDANTVQRKQQFEFNKDSEIKNILSEKQYADYAEIKARNIELETEVGTLKTTLTESNKNKETYDKDLSDLSVYPTLAGMPFQRII